MDRYVECVTCEERFAGERAIASFSREVEVDGEVETRCLSCIEKLEAYINASLTGGDDGPANA